MHEARLLMAVVPTPGRLLRAADIRVPNADSSAAALESSSAGSRVSKFRIGTGPRKASRSTTRAIRGRELPKSTVGFLLPGPQEIVPSTVPFAQVRRCAPGRRRPENQSRPRDRLFPPCNPVELSATFRPLPGKPPQSSTAGSAAVDIELQAELQSVHSDTTHSVNAQETNIRQNLSPAISNAHIAPPCRTHRPRVSLRWTS